MNDDFRYMKFIYLDCSEEMKLGDPCSMTGRKTRAL